MYYWFTSWERHGTRPVFYSRVPYLTAAVSTAAATITPTAAATSVRGAVAGAGAGAGAVRRTAAGVTAAAAAAAEQEEQKQEPYAVTKETKRNLSREQQQRRQQQRYSSPLEFESNRFQIVSNRYKYQFSPESRTSNLASSEVGSIVCLHCICLHQNLVHDTITEDMTTSAPFHSILVVGWVEWGAVWCDDNITPSSNKIWHAT